MITVIGVVVMLIDPEAKRTDGKIGSFSTYAVCIGCAFLGCFYFILNGLLVKALPIFSVLLWQSILGFLYQTIFLAVLYSKEFLFFSLDKNWGAFGFLAEEPVGVIFFGLSSGYFGGPGCAVCLLFFSPVTVTTFLLLCPFIGQMIGYWLDFDQMPGWLTWVGTSLVIAGIIAIQRAERQRKTDIQALSTKVNQDNKVTQA